MTPPQVLCIGFGALGTIYSFILEQGGAQVTAVARSNYSTLISDGIHIDSKKFGTHPGWKPHRVVNDAQQATDRFYDYVVCTFKCVPDLQPSSEVILPYLKKPTNDQERLKLPTIVLLQNGIGIEDEVRQTLVDNQEPLAHGIISAVAWIGANLIENGTKVEHGPMERLEFGTFSYNKDSKGLSISTQEEHLRLQKFCKIYQQGNGGGDISKDIEAVRWQKVLWNAGWGGLSTLSRQPVSLLLTEPNLHYSLGVVRRLCLEILYVARACGLSEERMPSSCIDGIDDITLSSSCVPQFQQQHQEGGTGSPPLARNFKPSLLLDCENQRPMELEPIVGHIVEKARIHHINTPRLDLLLAALKPCQIQAIYKAKKQDPNDLFENAEKIFSFLIATSYGSWPAGNPVPLEQHRYV